MHRQRHELATLTAPIFQEPGSRLRSNGSGWRAPDSAMFNCATPASVGLQSLGAAITCEGLPLRSRSLAPTHRKHIPGYQGKQRWRWLPSSMLRCSPRWRCWRCR